jgi:hypothetical protein
MGENVGAMTIDALPAEQPRRPTIVKLNHHHEAIARWLLENPTRALKECAAHFGYTQAWLSCIIHSDAFQAKLRQMHDEADAVVIMDVPSRLRGIAAAALDGIAEQVDHAVKDGNGVLHRQFLHDTAELTLKSLGYGAPKNAPAPSGNTHFHQHQHKHLTVSPEVLGAARDRLLEAHAVQEASQLPAGGSSDLSTVQRLSTDLPTASPAEGAETSGADLSSTSGGVST